VRWLEARSPNIWPPTILLTLGGVALNVYSVFAPNLTISGVASIIGITLLWDAFEMYRQQHRVMQGHAPANPDNPRHAAYLAAGMGTTEDLLDREPTGQPVAQPAAPAPRPEVGVMPATASRDYSYEEVEV
jgi:hypothetical protein